MPSPSDKRISPPLVDLPIRTASKGFYDGFSREVTIPAKVIVSLLIMWAIFFPDVFRVVRLSRRFPDECLRRARRDPAIGAAADRHG